MTGRSETGGVEQTRGSRAYMTPAAVCSISSFACAQSSENGAPRDRDRTDRNARSRKPKRDASPIDCFEEKHVRQNLPQILSARLCDLNGAILARGGDSIFE